ncbi:hypothetical protein CEXT_317561 [Caerostris extrusa]|uniref:Uncharacterized protein n=1 Tax=Caerostris extrusa TaxID=172846 RepID=A0AAV4QZ16_CAEEX|nr:hypothetical protein CEXT_317561 [Caerostris extrusa]
MRVLGNGVKQYGDTTNLNELPEKHYGANPPNFLFEVIEKGFSTCRFIISMPPYMCLKCLKTFVHKSFENFFLLFEDGKRRPFTLRRLQMKAVNNNAFEPHLGI